MVVLFCYFREKPVNCGCRVGDGWVYLKVSVFKLRVLRPRYEVVLTLHHQLRRGAQGAVENRVWT